MKIFNPFLTKFLGLLSAGLIRRWMSTLDYRGAYYEPTIDLVHPENRQPTIYLFWHEYILTPLYLRGNCNISFLLSQHADAEILSRTAHYLGFQTIRGSSTRGGVSAVRELLRKGQLMNLSMTPDGPLGPRRSLALGPIYLAAKTGLPIVAAGLGYDRPWRLNSWDRFAIPRPGSRVRAVVSPAITIPSDLDRDGLETYRHRIEELLNRLTTEAEAWSEHGGAKLGDVPMRREPAPNRRWMLSRGKASNHRHSRHVSPESSFADSRPAA